MIKKKITYNLLNKLLWLKKNEVGYAVLTYHNIIPDDESDLSDPMTIKYSEFQDQLIMVSNNFQIISVSELHERIIKEDSPSKLYVSITFDDGFLNQSILAAPLLKTLNIPATFFITTDFADQRTIPQIELWKYWIKSTNKKIYPDQAGIDKIYDLTNISEKIKLYKSIIALLPLDAYEHPDLNLFLKELFDNGTTPSIYMNWDEIVRLNKNPIFTIGAHSVSHPNFKKADNFLEEEVIKSKFIIEKNINEKIKYFAYPFGTKNQLNNKIIEKMKFADIDLAFSSIIGLNNNPKSLFCLNRIAPLCNEQIKELNTKIYWAEEIRKLKKIFIWGK